VGISSSNNRGFTLVELLVAIVITLVGLLGLFESVNVATVQNLKNHQRDEAVNVAETWMNHFRAVPFDQISTCPTCPDRTYHYGRRDVPSNLRGVLKPYGLNRSTVISGTGNSVELVVRVGWTYKNLSSAHEVHSARAQ
jgi:type IV pilus assembly protein PilV